MYLIIFGMLAPNPKFGQLKLKTGCPIQQSMIKDLSRYTIRDHQVFICRRTWGKKKFAERVKGFEEWGVYILRVPSNSEPGIIRDIMHIGFPHLTFIDISHNNIETLENFNRVNFPVLQTLICIKNKVNNLDPLRKINCPALKHLDLDGNELRVYNQLWQCNLPNLTIFDFSMFSHHISEHQMTQQYEKAHFNFVWMANLNSKVHQLLTVIKPLYPKGFIKALERKWNLKLIIKVGK